MKPLHFTTREEWRFWLEENFQTAKEAWLVYPNKATGEMRIVYNDAVEEALCFGWIDSMVKRLDEQHMMQRYSPRNPKSTFSQPNKERFKWLLENHLVHPDYIPMAQNAIKNPFVFPEDIMAELQKNPVVWENYLNLSDGYKRIRIAYIDASRKRPDEFEKRLNSFISKTEANKLIRGHGGIEKYY